VSAEALTEANDLSDVRPPKAARFNLGSLLSLAILVTLVGGWQIAAKTGVLPAFVLPAPLDVAYRVIEDLSLPSLRTDLLFTLTEIVVGFIFAALLGVVLGVAIALVPLVDRILSPYVIALQTIPKVAIAPLLIIWFGFGIESKIIIVALIDFFPILVNAVVGFRSVDSRQLLLMKVLNASRWQTFIKIRLPNSMPYLMAGVQISMVFSVIGAVVGEFLGSAQGLGSQIVQRQSNMDVIGVFSVLVILTVLGLLLNSLTKFVARKAAFWAASEQSAGF
jgi:NitT/TauT family transport system permease protein